TATLLAQLADEGKLSWDDPVRRHLPDFHLADQLADRDVTLRDLVTHRTGVASHDLLWYRAAWGLDEMVRRGGEASPGHPVPGRVRVPERDGDGGGPGGCPGRRGTLGRTGAPTDYRAAGHGLGHVHHGRGAQEPRPRRRPPPGPRRAAGPSPLVRQPRAEP